MSLPPLHRRDAAIMGLFKKSAAQREAEEAEQKRLEEEEYQRKVKEKQEEQARIAEATRKQMEAAKAKRESQAPKKAIAEGATASTKVHRSGGLGTGEAATINEQVRLKMEEARKRKEAEAKRKDEERRKREEEMRARGEEVNDLPTAGAMKWGIAASKLGSASLKMKALQEEQAMKGVWKRPDQGDADDGDVPQQPQAKAADPTENGIGRPLPKPTKTISIADKNAARSAAALAGGLFLTYDEKVTLDERGTRHLVVRAMLPALPPLCQRSYSPRDDHLPDGPHALLWCPRAARVSALAPRLPSLTNAYHSHV